MSILDSNSVLNNTQLEIEKDNILKFLYQYAYGKELYVDDYEEYRQSEKLPYFMLSMFVIDNDPWSNWEMLGDGSIKSPTYTPKNLMKDVSKYFLELVNNQWIIRCLKPNMPIPIINYEGDSFPDYIRFENGVMLWVINTYSKAFGNFGY